MSSVLQRGGLQDRTGEFWAVVDTVRKRRDGSGAQLPVALPSSASNATSLHHRGAGGEGAAPVAADGLSGRRARSEFAVCAAQIGKGIHATCVKLEQLAKLAQSRSLFDDHAEEMNRLTEWIKHDIAQLNGRLEELQRRASRAGALSSAPSSGGGGAGQHVEVVVSSLKARLMQATQDFQGVLHVRTENMRRQDERKRQFGNAAAVPRSIFDARPPPPPSSVAPSAPSAFTPTATTATIGTDSGAAVIDLGSGSLGATSAAAPAQAQEQALLSYPTQQEYYQQRANAAQQVESTIVELGQIFHQLAQMVAEQGEVVERIDANVEDTLHNVHGAREQLLQYFESLRTSRGLILKLSGVMIVFIFLWVLVL